MKIDLNRRLVDLDGNTLKWTIAKTLEDGKQNKFEEEIILWKVLENALLIENPSKPIPPLEKIGRFNLARRVHKKGDVEFSAEEIVLLKRLVLETYPPLTSGQIAEILDPKEKG